jgi:hypothetical protein
MKKFDLGQSISIFANLGVIAGIVFLALELHQNNELMDAEQQFNRLTIATGSATLLAENPELASAVAKLNDQARSIENIDLSPGERVQLNGFYGRVIQNQEWTFRALPQDELPVSEWKSLARQRSWRYHWDERRGTTAPDFVLWMDGNVLN